MQGYRFGYFSEYLDGMHGSCQTFWSKYIHFIKDFNNKILKKESIKDAFWPLIGFERRGDDGWVDHLLRILGMVLIATTAFLISLNPKMISSKNHNLFSYSYIQTMQNRF